MLFLGPDMKYSRCGVVTVMKSILSNSELECRADFILVCASAGSFHFHQKVRAWLKAIARFLYYVPRVDLVHIHHASDFNFIISSYLARFAKAIGKKVILHNHSADFDVFYHRCDEAWKKAIIKTFNRVDAIIVLSQSWLEWYRQLAPEAPWVLLPNAVEIPVRSLESRPGSELIQLLYLGRVEQRKGIVHLLQALRGALQTNGQLLLRVAGNGDIPKLKKRLIEQRLDGHVQILGYLEGEEKERILAETDIFVLPSYKEGLPMSLLEAMAWGVVPVATRVGGIPEVIIDGYNGLLVDPGNKGQLLQAILKLAQDPDLRATMSNNARETIATNYCIDAYAKRLLEIYSEMIEKLP